MKLCIPIEVKPEGGMYTFIGYLKAWLTRRGIAHTSSLDEDYDVLFANSWVVPYSTIRRLKRERLDVAGGSSHRRLCGRLRRKP